MRRLVGLWARWRRAWSGQPPEEHEQQLMQLYWNRAELKKELASQQEQRHALGEKLRLQEAATRRAIDQQEQLQAYLGNPEYGANALVYFQLRALWKLGAEQLANFVAELRRQQDDRERKRHQRDQEERRAEELAGADEQLANARSAAATLQARVELLINRRADLGRWWILSLWNYSRRRALGKEITHVDAEWKAASAQIEDCVRARADLAAQPLREFPGMSVEGRRMVNTAALAYAEYLIGHLPHRGLVSLAKDAMNVQVYDIQFGAREECARLLALIKTALQVVGAASNDLTALKDFTDRVRARVQYRGSLDTVPIADSVAVPVLTAAPATSSPLDRKSGELNVLVEDYWNVTVVLLR
jgi:hypothetical protein